MVKKLALCFALAFAPNVLAGPACLGEPTISACTIQTWYDLSPYPPALSLKAAVESEWFRGNYQELYEYCDSPSPNVARVSYNGCQNPGYLFDFTFVARTSCPPGSPAAQAPTQTGSSLADAGNHHQVEIDYRGALPLIRTYNSTTAQTKSTLGWGWRHNYERTIQRIGNTVYALRPNGRTVTFHLVGEEWTPDSGTDRLIQMMYTPWNSWLYGTTDGDQETWELYDAAGRIVQIAGGPDVWQVMRYGSPLESVLDVWGRTMQFAYNEVGQLIAVTAPSGAVSRYTYDGAGNLASASYITGLVRQYKYDEPGLAGGAPAHTLTGIVDNDVRSADIRYDAQGASIPPSGNSYVWQTNESQPATLIGLVIPLPIGVPPPTGTMGGLQPPANHAVPVPPDSRDRPTERPERPGSPVLSVPIEPSASRKQQCDAAAQACLNALEPGTTLDNPYPGNGRIDGKCPPPSITAGGQRCLNLWTLCLITKDRIVFPDGSEVPAEQ